MATPGRRRIDPADKRDRILRAAAEVFAQKPFEEASVSEIVGRAGVAQGTFYRYFPSKTHLVSALSDEVNAEVVAEIESVLNREEPLADLLEPLIRAAARVMERNRRLLSVIDTETLLFGESAQAETRREPYYERLASLIERDQQRGLLIDTSDPQITARLVGSVMDRLARDILANPSNRTIDHYLTQAVAFLRRGLGTLS